MDNPDQHLHALAERKPAGTYRIRDGAPGDLEEIVALLAQETIEDGQIPDRERLASAVSGAFIAGAQVLVVEHDSKVVGLSVFNVILHPRTGVQVAAGLALTVAADHVALTADLLRESEARAVSLGATEAIFTSPRPKAQRLFEAAGYNPVQVVMSKALSAHGGRATDA